MDLKKFLDEQKLASKQSSNYHYIADTIIEEMVSRVLRVLIIKSLNPSGEFLLSEDLAEE
jgi:hypothetical protein